MGANLVHSFFFVFYKGGGSAWLGSLCRSEVVSPSRRTLVSPSVDDDTAIVYDDTFTDDFARMTMFVHGGGGSVRRGGSRGGQWAVDSGQWTGRVCSNSISSKQRGSRL